MNIGFYGVLPATVRYDKELRPLVRLLYAEVSAAMDYRRECVPDMTYFSRLLDVTESTVEQYIRQLVSRKHLVKHRANGKMILSIPAVLTYVKEEETTSKKRVKKEKPEAQKASEVLMEIIALWNSLNKRVLKHHYKMTVNIKRQLTSRLESFTKEDIMAALRSRHAYCEASPWHQQVENLHHATNIEQVIGSDDKLSKSLNMATKTVKAVDLKKDTQQFKTGNTDKNVLE